MADSGIPDKFLPAVRLAVFWIALPFILLLAATDRYFAGTGYEVAACVAGAFLSIVIAVYWDKIFRRPKLTIALWIMAALGLLLFGGAIGALAVRGDFLRTSSEESQVTTQTTASSSPAPSVGIFAPKASLRLLMRPNQDPQELAKDNIWRWFVFKTVAQAPDGKLTTLATYIFVTFDPPIQTNYRRVFSPSNPALRFDVPDLTARSMVVTINNIDLAGETVEIDVSGTPL